MSYYYGFKIAKPLVITGTAIILIITAFIFILLNMLDIKTLIAIGLAIYITDKLLALYTSYNVLTGGMYK